MLCGIEGMAMYRHTNTGPKSLKVVERPIYGSSRIGSYTQQIELAGVQAITNYPYTQPMSAFLKRYELADHLGNVSTVVTGRLLDGAGAGSAKQAEVVSAQGYEPGGSLLPGRNYSSDAYRFGFGGQLKDNEVYGSEGTSYTAEFWQYDSRTGRRWNLDPKPNLSISPYATFALNPILVNDANGDTIHVTTGKGAYMFSLDNGQCEIQTMTASDVYKLGTQWFEPLADNYMPISAISSEITCMSEIKHFTWDQVAAFAETNRAPISFAGGLSGDWKSSSAGAGGFLMVEVEGMPYWSDAVGQIPFAVNTFKHDLLNQGNWNKSETDVGRGVLGTGKTFQHGFWSGVTTTMGLTSGDNSNTYDNFMIGRGVQYASDKYSLQVREYLNSQGQSGRNASLLGTSVPARNLGNSLTKTQADRWQVSDKHD